MLCSRLRQILPQLITKNNNIQCRCLTIPSFILKKCRRDSFITSILRNKTDVFSMSTIRFLIKDLRVYRFWSVWTRNVNVGSVVRRCRRDRSVREVFQSFRTTFLRTPKTLLISATAALNIEDEDDEEVPCEKNITDEELQILLKDLETIQELSKKTLYCEKCNERLTIDNKKLPGVKYCSCKEPGIPEPPEDGWVPYMEADDVIIWRKEYKPGQGLFAYKVYGRYNDVTAQDFAAIQVDGGYRKVWDTAVAALSIVERSANGIMDQAILHWEVLWPRLFANRDYVYIRRHKEFDLDGTSVTPVSGSGSDVSGQKPDLTGQKPDITGQKPDVTSQKPVSEKRTEDQKQSSDQNQKTDQKQKIDQKDNLSDQSETHETDVKETTDSRGTKVTIIRKKRKKPDETVSSADIPASGDNPSADKPTPEKTAELPKNTLEERPSVHSNAKRKSQESYEKNEHNETKEHSNKAYVIISRSCTHPDVPATKNAIRVTEYWSNMVIRTLEGSEDTGMEFVLTYYDEPAVGGLPSAVSSFATGRAAPAFLARMRIAAKEYADFIQRKGSMDAPDFKTRPTKVSYEDRDIINEEDMESSKHGPELNGYKQEMPEVPERSERGTQTEDSYGKSDRDRLLIDVSYRKQERQDIDDDDDDDESNEQELSWWRQLYPFYYFAS